MKMKSDSLTEMLIVFRGVALGVVIGKKKFV
jgi:hypothetical protein